VGEEVTLLDLPVSGTLPPELHGSFLRNGPNPRTPSPHWFIGDGMVHGLSFADGRATVYRNRWVRTRPGNFIEPDGTRNLEASKANTHVVRHAGKILALVEVSLPYELTPDLETVGPWDFDGRLTTPMTAHPKACPITGELHFFGYDFQPPFLTYHVVDAAGRLTTSRAVETKGSTMMHDFNLSERFVVFMDLPLVFDVELAMTGKALPYRYDPSYGARLGVLCRDDPHGEVRWFEIDPCYVFHPLNAHDDGNVITIDVARYAELDEDRIGRDDAVLWRWTIDQAAGTVSERQLDDRRCEFPRIDDRLVGRPADRGWVANVPPADEPGQAGAITAYDLTTGASRTHRFGPGQVPGEAVFAPADDRPGGPGWLLTYVFDPARGASDLVVLDADDVDGAPVAEVHLPVRVPYGFHGSWLPTG
jgi:carotenoid cleavage dioxygenase